MITELDAYKSPISNDKTETRSSPLKEIDILENDEQIQLLDIIMQLSQESITDDNLSAIEQILIKFPRELIPCDLPSQCISEILEKYKNTQNSLEENCITLVIECFSLIDDYLPILNDFFGITIEKISNSSPNSFLMLKILANIFDSLEDKENSLISICLLFQTFFENNDYQAFDYLIQFLYNYSNSQDAIESGAILISETLLSLFQNCEEKSINPSSFAMERIFWILYSLISKFTVDFSLILDHPIIKNKNTYLYNSNYKIVTAYITLSGLLFDQKLNPFDLHIFDFIPFLKSNDKSLISPSIWIIGIIINFSQEMVDELIKYINLSIFKDIYADTDFNGKVEIAHLYQHLLNAISSDQYFDFFMDNSDMLLDFLNLEDEIVLANIIQFVYCLHSLLIEEGEDTKFESFVNTLLNNGFRDFLDDLIYDGKLTLEGNEINENF